MERLQDSVPHGQRGKVSRVVARDFRFSVIVIAPTPSSAGGLLAVSGMGLSRFGATHLGRVLGVMSRQKVLAACTGSKPR